MKLFLLGFILTANLYSYVDMSDRNARAKDLGMRNKDYSLAMAFSGLFTGSIFGLFLWKVK